MRASFSLLLVITFAAGVGLAQSPADPLPAGSATAGAEIFTGKGACQTCHRVQGKGSRLGPDLTDIGLTRTAAQLETSLVDPPAEVLPENRFYRVVTRDGATITGKLLNLDTFQVLMLDSKEQLRHFLRSELREHGFDTGSKMPSYRTTLSRQELADLIAFLATLNGALTSSPLPGQMGSERLLNTQKEPQNWLTYSGGYMSQRHSQLTQITPANAKELELKWVFQARWLDYYQATPLVVDGVMYTTQGNDVLALDATTGKIFWIYPYTPAPDAKFCCGRITRGLAVSGEMLYLATIDAHLIAVDTKSGRPLWNTVVAPASAGYSMTTAPLVIRDKVIVGPAGGEFGIQGFIAAFDTATGKEAWRFNTVPQPGEPGHDTWGPGWTHGGGSIWVTGSYDPETNLTYWGVGNPGPDYNAETRPGDNLYTCSVVALDADTGKLKWHYQFTPADEFDWDAVQIPVLADITWKGSPRKVMLWANRNGFFYVLDRRTGEFLQATPIAKQNWNAGFDNGRPIRAPSAMPSRDGVLIYPGNQGATNWFSPSFSPRTGLFYVSVWENTHHIFARADQEYKEGAPYTQGRLTTNYPGRGIQAGMRAVQRPNLRMEEENFGTVRAFDPQTGKWRWEFKMSDLTDAGILTTASDVLFSGGREGYFFALDARSGSLLWKIQLGGPVQNGPMTYAVDGKQYVAVSASNSLFVFGLR